MPAENESYSPVVGRPLSPLRQAMFGRGIQDLDAWLAGMNAVALFFLMIAAGAWLPSATASRLKPSLPLGPAPEFVELEIAPEPAPAAAAPEDPETGGALDSPEPVDPPVPEEPIAYRELPEMIDPVPVVEPERRPVPPVKAGTRPDRETPPAASQTPRRQASSAQTAPNPGGNSGPGVPGGVPGASGAGAKPGSSVGRGTTPQPPYPAFARRDKLQGTVVVSISVNDGAVTAVRIVSSSGSPSLDQYAVSHVQRRWKWSAGTTRTFTQPFRFVLK